MYTVAGCDASGHGEGAVYGGSAVIATDGDGIVDFVVQSPATAVLGNFITATLTDQATGETSEFSNCVEVEAEPTPVPTPSSPTPSPTGPTPTPTPTPIPIETPPPSEEPTDAPTDVPTITITPTVTDSTDTPAETTPPLSETPTVTVTPTHTPEPTGSDILRQGDNDCSGAVTPRDSLWVFLFIAQLARDGFGACPSVGSASGTSFWADVDCDGDVDEDDAMAVLLWRAGFEYVHDDPCVEIGEVLVI
jgi:hypothetical protein